MAKMHWKENPIIEENIAELREKTFNKLSKICREEILKGFRLFINGEEYWFSFDLEAQLNLQNYQLSLKDGLINKVKLTVRHKGFHKRIELDSKAIDKIVVASIEHKRNHIDYLREVVYEKIQAAENIEELENIKWEMKNSEQ